MAVTEPLVRTVTATPDPPPVGVPNPIHADDGAAGAGYKAALVAGVRTYGWVAEATIETLGTGWLDDGWADITLRRPLYAGETVTITIAPATTSDVNAPAEGPGIWTVAATADDRVVLDGTIGMGSAAWLAEITPPVPAEAAETSGPLPTYTIDSVPLHQPLTPLGAYLTTDAAHRLAHDDLGLATSHVPPNRIHPWFLAARMAPLTRHNFTYGPTIHVRTQIQHLGPALADQQVVVNAQIVDAYDRKGHWYQVLDGVICGSGNELARLRHHTIFRPRPIS